MSRTPGQRSRSLGASPLSFAAPLAGANTLLPGQSQPDRADLPRSSLARPRAGRPLAIFRGRAQFLARSQRSDGCSTCPGSNLVSTGCQQVGGSAATPPGAAGAACPHQAGISNKTRRALPTRCRGGRSKSQLRSRLPLSAGAETLAPWGVLPRPTRAFRGENAVDTQLRDRRLELRNASVYDQDLRPGVPTTAMGLMALGYRPARRSDRDSGSSAEQPAE